MTNDDQAKPDVQDTDGEVGAPEKLASEQAKPKASEPPLLTPEKEKPRKENAEPKKKGRGPVWLALLLALAGLGGAGYTYWQLDQYRLAERAAQQNVEQNVAQDVEQIRALEAQLKEANAELQQELSRDRRRLQEQQQQIEALSARVSDSRRRIGEITLVSRNSWVLAEAEYLLRMANQRLLLEQEVGSALALLQAADQVLRDLDEVNLHTVRAMLANEIAALKAVGREDREGAFLTLAALAEQLQSLPLVNPRSEPVAEEAPAADWKQNLDSAMAQLRALITVRHRDQAIEPLLPPEQHYYLQQNLRLMLEQAQLALLQRKGALYRQSLEKARLWIGKYFELNTASGAMLESLADLQAMPVTAQFPDISQSLRLLKAYLANPNTDFATERSGVDEGP